MFDIGFLELIVVAALGLIVIGPERLPAAIRTVAIWIGTIKRTLSSARAEFERQIGADEIRRELHNEQVLASLKAAKESRDAIQKKLNNLAEDTMNSGKPQLLDEELPDHAHGASNSIEPAPTTSQKMPVAEASTENKTGESS